MSKHTPGPWEVTDCLPLFQGVDKKGPMVGRVVTIKGPEFGVAGRTGSALRDAVLIAAAPGLLDALREVAKIGASGVVLRHETGKPVWDALAEVRKIAEAAIAKAEGGEE